MLQKYLRRTRFQHQITVTVGLALLCLAVFSSLVTSMEATRRMEGYLVGQGQNIAQSLAQQSILALLTGASQNAEYSVDTTLMFPNVKQVSVIDTYGTVVATKATSQENLVPMDVQSLARPNSPTLISEDYHHWRFAAPVYDAAATDSPFDTKRVDPKVLGHVYVDLDKSTLKRLVTSLLIVNLAITLTVAAALLLIMRTLVRHLTDPLRHLAQLMGQAEGGLPGTRAIPDGPKDIIDMAQAFNHMMDVLDEHARELKKSRDDAIRTAIMKTQFAATVSHEVRTPLNGVVGMLDMLRDTKLTPHQQECLEVAWNSSRALTDMINDILDFSKMEAGKFEIEESDFDLHKVLDEVFALFVRQAQQKGVQLGYHIAPNVPDWVHGDPLRLRQVLLNLIGNAIKFTESGEVSVRITDSFEGVDRLALRFEVSDTGIGMTSDVVNHVFDLFTQADKSTSRKFGGTGLGLAISKQLVELMNGKIGVSSRLGEGSTFWFTVRCAPGAPVLEESDDTILAGKRALVVDESEIVRDFVHQVLGDCAMEVNAVDSGVSAVEALKTADRNGRPFELVIMDAATTDDHGGDLGMRIRGGNWSGAPAILTLDLYSSPNSVKVLGSSTVLGKPLSREKLVAVSKKMLKDRVPARPHPAEQADTNKPLAPTILVAEDNRTNQLVVSSMLSVAGFNCEIASNGRDAVEKARSGQFDLILMDCTMPEMDGYEATSHIRNSEATSGKHIPIIALTANAQRGDADKCRAAGMDDYIAKPITMVELRQKIDHWLGHSGKPKMIQMSMLAAMGVPEVNDTPVDKAVFENLRSVLGPALDLALRQFLEDTPQYLRRLEESVTSGDARAALTIAHTIKGSCSNLGVVHMAQLTRDVEDALGSPSPSTARPLIPHLRHAYDRAAKVLSSELQGGQPTEVSYLRTSTRILVVDDDRSTRSSIRYVLENNGFEVFEASDGEEALATVSRIRPDVILMDGSMPNMDGFTACEHLQQSPETKQIPVLIITALEDKISIERAFSAGASDYIPKPIHYRVLSERVRKTVDSAHAERRIREWENNDPLTGLPNRPMFFQRLQELLESTTTKGDSVFVLYLDIDRFKNVNDSYGVGVGDKLLVAVSKRILHEIRGAECVGRLGGDVFGVLLSNQRSASEVSSLARNLGAVLTRRFQIDGHDIVINASIGVAAFPRDASDESTLLKNADTAMTRAKKNSTGVEFFDPSMDHSFSEEVRTTTELHRALDRGEFELYYQPQVRVDSGTIVGVEALIRWNHPKRGLVSPPEFIPLAEESDLIITIGEWVLRTACAQAVAWQHSALPPMRVAVNISGKQIMQAGFADIVERVLRETGLSPNRLELEITESMLMEHAGQAATTLRKITDSGVRLSIDDFGTGYSSLSYLTDIPINVVKIDRLFVRDALRDADDAEIIKSVLTLAHSLHLEVVAEGVESDEQFSFLSELGCDIVQGYRLSIPVPHGQLPEIIANHTKRWIGLAGQTNMLS